MKIFTDILESKNFTNLPNEKVAILFTDIEKSSELWSKNEDEMFEALDILEDIIHDNIDKEKGMVVKTIGDSFMCSYKNLLNAIKSAVNIQKYLNENPIKVGDRKIKLRIGICYGTAYVKETIIQRNKLIDYFGNMVGTASRLESMVSNTNGFAFAFLEDVDEKEILSYLEENDINIDVIEYDNTCDISKRKRSNRLLTDLQIKSCKDVDELKGISELRVYKCDFK